jgi:hypothetical protein
MKIKQMLLIFVLLPIATFSLEKAPWFGNDNEFESRAAYSFDWHNKFDVANGSETHRARNHHLDLSLAFATMSLYHAELELKAANTGVMNGDRDLDLEAFSLGARYLWLNDLVGDNLSLTTGASLSFVPFSVTKNPNLMRHGEIELAAHAAVGKERSEGRTWTSRLWAALELAMGNQGSPWVKGDVCFEKNFADTQQMKGFVEFERGFGNQKLNSLASFKGYKTLRYETVTAGLRYAYQLGVWGDLSCQYAYGLHAKFAPQNAHSLTLGYRLPFSL